jgi:hypothetical protein
LAAIPALACRKVVTLDVPNLIRETLEKCSNALDQLCPDCAGRPKLSELPKRGGYFPAARDEQGFRSTMGQWKASDIDKLDPDFACRLRAVQPPGRGTGDT